MGTVWRISAIIADYEYITQSLCGLEKRIVTFLLLQRLVSASEPFCDKRDLGWYAICSQHKEKVLNITKSIKGNVFTFETIYADNNRVILTYTQKVPATHDPLLLISLMHRKMTMQKGITL